MNAPLAWDLVSNGNTATGVQSSWADDRGMSTPRADGTMSVDISKPKPRASSGMGFDTLSSKTPRKNARSASSTLEAGEAKRVKTEVGMADKTEDAVTDWHCW